MSAFALKQTAEEETYQPLIKPRATEGARRQRRVRTMQLREQGAVSPLAIIGMLAVCVLVSMVIYMHIKLDDINAEQTKLNAQLTALEKNYADLSAEYETIFDLDEISESLTANGSMVQAAADQKIYMDLSKPDSAEAYESEENDSGLAIHFSMFDGLTDLFEK